MAAVAAAYRASPPRIQNQSVRRICRSDGSKPRTTRVHSAAASSNNEWNGYAKLLKVPVSSAVSVKPYQATR